MTTTPTVPLCIDCIHFRAPKTSFTDGVHKYSECRRDATLSLVDGKTLVVESLTRYCAVNRAANYPEACGPEGKHFIQRKDD